MYLYFSTISISEYHKFQRFSVCFTITKNNYFIYKTITCPLWANMKLCKTRRRTKYPPFLCYINDINTVFTSSFSDPVALNSTRLNCLYTDLSTKKKITCPLWANMKMCKKRRRTKYPHFQCYINDINKIFTSSFSDPIALNSTKINCLYTDLLVLLSERKEDLKSCLDALQMYCDSWKRLSFIQNAMHKLNINETNLNCRYASYKTSNKYCSGIYMNKYI